MQVVKASSLFGSAADSARKAGRAASESRSTMIAIDTETTGVDLYHGARPFFVTTCDLDGQQEFWQWDVDPLTREVAAPPADVAAIRDILKRQAGWAAFDAETRERHVVVGQNIKFDVAALRSVGVAEWPWSVTRCTLVAGHLLASNLPHNLTDMVEQYCGIEIQPYENALEEACKEARSIARRQLPEWRIAKEGERGMPSLKGSGGGKGEKDRGWKNDTWLPRALLHHWRSVGDSRAQDHEDWETVLAEYGNADSFATLKLWQAMRREIERRGLWAIYLQHNHMPRLDDEMQRNGVTVVGDYTERTIAQYRDYVHQAGVELVGIAAEYAHDLELAKGASINNNMRELFYDKFGLPPVYGPKTKGPSLDKDAMQHYLATTEGGVYDFLRILADKRKRDTDLSYMEGYCRFWLPVPGAPGFWRIHPNLNPCGTDHLRQSGNAPNLQNVGGQEDECPACVGAGRPATDCPACAGSGKSRMSVKHCFGPAPGREWYSMDYQSIEARLPAYESGESKMVELFERPDQPPYWGNLYYLTASVLYSEEFWPWVEDKNGFRKKHPRLYKRAKFFVLAKNYGAGRAKGDLLSGVKNSYDLVNSEFPKLAALQARCLRDAQRLGYVETIPDRTVDPKRGYPILVARTEEGRVLSTTPFNYHISSTACWCKNKAMWRCSGQLARWRAAGFDGRLILEIHDELLFDFPRGLAADSNLDRALALKYLMEKSGRDIGIPTPVKVEYHAKSWAEGVPI